MIPFKYARPTSRGDRRKAHEFRASLAHTHNVTSKRKPGTYVDVRCTRADCTRKP